MADLRKLKALREAGVIEYREGDLYVRFADSTPHVQASEQHVDAGDLDVPTGVYDPRKDLERIYGKDRPDKSS